MPLARPRGTRDFGPAEMQRRRKVERAIRSVLERHGYGEVQTPTFERLELFLRRSGTEIMDQVYAFKDKGGRDLVLRPELTAPVMRFFEEELSREPRPLKLYYMGNCFRYERPQAGRYREFWQIGCEYVGDLTPLAEAECVAMARQCIRAAGLRNARLRLGHIGVLRGLLAHLGFAPGSERAAMIAIDKGDEQGLEEMILERGASYEAARAFIDLLRPVSLAEAESLRQGCLAAGSPVDEALSRYMAVASLLPAFGADDALLDLGIARGLDYYTGTVFECDAPELGAEKQVCGGGTYGLREVLGTDTEESGIGFAIGFDRLMLALELEGAPPQAAAPDVLVAYRVGELAPGAAAVAARLRSEGISTDLDLSGTGIGKALAKASKRAVPFAVLLFEDEWSRGRVVLKDLGASVQEELPLEEAVARIRARVDGMDGG